MLMINSLFREGEAMCTSNFRSFLNFVSRRLVEKCYAAYMFFKEHKKQKDIYWIKHHEDIRRHLMAFMSDEQYEMSDTEYAF